MTDTDRQFFKNMLSLPEIGYCSNIDKKWEKTKLKTKNRKKREKVRR